MNKPHKFSAVSAWVLTAVCVVPYLLILWKSLRSQDGFTGAYYYEVFLAENQYLSRFWKSIALACAIAAVQVAVSAMAGYGFAKCQFPGKNGIFFCLMLLMMMPLQVTLVPNYLMLDQMHLLNTRHALSLPPMFAPLGTFLMTQSFRSVPNSVIEAARLDGCSTLGILLRIAAPLGKSGLVCTMLLSFLDGWNMVEQPMVYLEDFSLYPLSVGLASVPLSSPTVQLAACVLAALPPVFLFAYYNRELVEGIALGGEK